MSGQVEVTVDMGLNSLTSHLVHWLYLKVYKTNS